jgi:N-acetylneuraminic acid mutarotase
MVLACLSLQGDAQKSEWTWMGGRSTLGVNGGQSGLYGTLGVVAAGNTPGGRDGAASWTGSDGHFWLFGGQGYDANGTLGYLNDLWEFDPSDNEWVWVSGSNAVGGHGGQPGVYGTLGQPAAGNTPGSRNGAATWTDTDGNLWLFGGWVYDSKSIAGELNDLWEFVPSTSEWAWMGGSSAVGPHDGQSGVYGTLGTAAAGNNPGGLYAASSWIDSGGNFWLFGGQGYDGNGNFHELNALWEFNAATAEWTWMGGSKSVSSDGDVPGVYGTLGTAATGNIPGNRSDASSWTGNSLWLFGGIGYDADGNGGYLNDLWQFDPTTNEWAWTSGSSTVGSNGGQSGVYGVMGALAAGNVPGGRSQATSWTDAKGILWLLGGYGVDAGGNGGYLNDLWQFDPAASEWAWTSGSSTVGGNGGQSGVYGTLGNAAAGNVPGGRDAANGWTDSNGNLWLFGGYGYDSSGNYGYLNDLWEFQPSTASSSAATPTFSPQAGTYATAQTVTISDATSGAIIYYTTDGTTPTVSSTVYAGAITVSSTETLKAIATASGLSTSAAAIAAYIIGAPAAATPSFSPSAGTYAATQTVTISDGTPGAIIYFTTDGTTPTTSSTVYAGAITVSSTETLQAVATASGLSNSTVAIAAYTIGAPATATPSFSPPAGAYAAAQTVTISDATAGAIIYYTTNGTTPTTSSIAYAGTIKVSSTETLQAIAIAGGHSASTVASATYTIGGPAPTFTVTGTAVTISPGAETGNASTISITPSGGFTGAVALTVAITASPIGALDTPTLSFGSTSPAQITGVSAATSTLTVFSTAASSAAVAFPARAAGHRYFLGGTALACLLLFFVPARSRLRTMCGLAALFAVLACGVVACGSSVNRTAMQSNPGTTPGTYTLTVTGTSGAITETAAITLNVQ